MQAPRGVLAELGRKIELLRTEREPVLGTAHMSSWRITSSSGANSGAFEWASGNNRTNGYEELSSLSSETNTHHSSQTHSHTQFRVSPYLEGAMCIRKITAFPKEKAGMVQVAVVGAPGQNRHSDGKRLG